MNPYRVPPRLLLLLLLLLSLHFAPAQEVVWQIPPDGGTPRDPQRIQRIAQHEFLIRASVEEGTSVLKHAVSRIDLTCQNSNAEPVNVTLHLDLSGDGQRTDYDTKPESGMPRRNFI